ncbi:MAG TPA: transposase [Tepidisphaeraceae bacterium]|jgi:putative transposase|nr:transposase [Tepidisphaeraceae bacterium]
MPRTARQAPGQIIYHVLNRSVAGRPIFDEGPDFNAFVRVLNEAVEKFSIRLLGWCVMSNHWHLILWPREDGELSAFMRWLTTTHVRRWHQYRKSSGHGPIYQGRFKSFPVETNEYLLTLMRYVERNPLRAGMVQRAEHWLYSSLCQRIGTSTNFPPLTPSPVPIRSDWLEWLNEPQTDKEIAELRESIKRGRPYGTPQWQAKISEKLSLSHTFRNRGGQTKRA